MVMNCIPKMVKTVNLMIYIYTHTYILVSYINKIIKKANQPNAKLQCTEWDSVANFQYEIFHSMKFRYKIIHVSLGST